MPHIRKSRTGQNLVGFVIYVPLKYHRKWQRESKSRYGKANVSRWVVSKLLHG